MKAPSLLFFVLTTLVGCTQSPEPHLPLTTTFNGNSMTIDYHIVIGRALNENESATVEMIVQETFDEINQIYNKWNPSSEISRINRLPARQKVPLSPQLESLFKLIDQIYEMSEERFDPTVEPIQQLWKKYLYIGQIPTENEINDIRPAIGWKHIHIRDGMVWKDHDKTSLDLGGIAKGLCVDLLVERLNTAGYPDVFVEWGGEIRASGQHPDPRPWQIYITRFGDTSPKNAIAQLSLQDESIATSGDYEQFWKIELPSHQVLTFFHVFDTHSCQPLKVSAQRVSSSSVMAPSCALADGLATVTLTFETIDQAEAWCHKIEMEYPEISFWLVTRTYIP